MKAADWINVLAKPAKKVDVVILRRDGHGLNCAAIAARCKTNVEVLTTDDAWPAHALTIRWGCTSNLPKKGEALYNKAAGIKTTFDKGAFRRVMAAEGIAPKVYTTPEEWFAAGQPEVVIRPQHHIRGQDFFKVKEIADVIKAIEACGDGFYMSEVVDVRKEVRVWFFGGRVLFVCHNNRAADKYEYIGWGEWPMNAVKNAAQAMALSGLDFGAVDVMIDGAGKAMVSEVNTSPEVLGKYQQERVAFAIDYVVEKGTNHLPIIDKAGWKGYIHPCVSDKAIME